MKILLLLTALGYADETCSLGDFARSENGVAYSAQVTRYLPETWSCEGFVATIHSRYTWHEPIHARFAGSKTWKTYDQKLSDVRSKLYLGSRGQVETLCVSDLLGFNPSNLTAGRFRYVGDDRIEYEPHFRLTRVSTQAKTFPSTLNARECDCLKDQALALARAQVDSDVARALRELGAEAELSGVILDLQMSGSSTIRFDTTPDGRLRFTLGSAACSGTREPEIQRVSAAILAMATKRETESAERSIRTIDDAYREVSAVLGKPQDNPQGIAKDDTPTGFPRLADADSSFASSDGAPVSPFQRAIQSMGAHDLK